MDYRVPRHMPMDTTKRLPPYYPYVPPSTLPFAMGPSNMAFEHALRDEIRVRDERIRKLEMENMRLQVKLEQAEKDVQMATGMIMVACRSSGGMQHAQEPVTLPAPPRVEDLDPATSTNGSRTPIANGGWGGTRPADHLGVERFHFDSGFAGAGDDATEARRAGFKVHNGWSWGHEDKVPAHGESSSQSQVGGDGSGVAIHGAGDTGHARWRGTAQSNLSRPKSPHEQPKSPAARKMEGVTSHVEKELSSSNWQTDSLLDLGTFSASRKNETTSYKTPPQLRPLTPFAHPQLASPFKTATRSNKAGNALPFRHLFAVDDHVPVQADSVPEAHHKIMLQHDNIMSPAVVPVLISKIPAVQFRERTRDAIAHSEPVDIPKHKRETSDENSYPVSSDNKIHSSAELPTPDVTMAGHQISNDTDPNTSFESMRDSRGVHRTRHRGGQGFNYFQPFRYNANKSAPWNIEDVNYSPVEDANNYMRTVMVYNLPPQADVSEIVARVGDAPLLSIKLLPTMGMKGRKADGSIGTLETMTAMMIFALDTSAEQFVFDISNERLVIRGRTAVVKLSETPTYPSCLFSGAYSMAPGRILTRRIRFQQPGLVPADRFDEILAGRSYGFMQPGWIVDKTMKKEAGRNMITVEFASVETARFAFEQMEWLREFQGCEPRWVYDHEAATSKTGVKMRLKTRDDEDNSDGEVPEVRDDHTVSKALPMAVRDGLSSSKHARAVMDYGEVEVAPAVPSFRALPDFSAMAKAREPAELDY